MTNNIREIDVELLIAHPDNPRKDVGDVSELAASIRHSGIMQNLTVTPFPAGTPLEDHYYVIIGHRRLAAARQVGLKTVPCAVVDMDPTEQIATMLAENMQRTDLTMPEQVAGIQMCLDLGMDDDEVMKRTGFSRSTYSKRKKLITVDNKVLAKGTNKGLTIEDWVLFAEIPDGEEKEALERSIERFNNGSGETVFGIRSKIETSNKAAFNDQFLGEVVEPFMERESIEKGNPWSMAYTSGWDKIAEYELAGKKNNESAFLDAMLEVDEHAPDLAWCIYDGKVQVYKHVPVKDDETPEEKAQRKKKEQKLETAKKRAMEQKKLMDEIKERHKNWIAAYSDEIETADSDFFPSGDAAIAKQMMSNSYFWKWNCRGRNDGEKPEEYVEHIKDPDLIDLFSVIPLWAIHEHASHDIHAKHLPEIKVLTHNPRYYYVCMWFCDQMENWRPYMTRDSKIGMMKFTREQDIVQRSIKYYQALSSLGYVPEEDERQIMAGTHPLQKGGA